MPNKKEISLSVPFTVLFVLLICNDSVVAGQHHLYVSLRNFSVPSFIELNVNNDLSHGQRRKVDGNLHFECRRTINVLINVEIFVVAEDRAESV